MCTLTSPLRVNTPHVIGVTPGDPERDLGPWLAAVGAGGLPAVLLREPTRSAGAYAALVAQARRSVPLVILHGRHPTALDRVAADPTLGLHLPSDIPLPSAWPGGAPATLGVSCHSADALDAAFASGASYAFLSPVFAPTSKVGDRRPPLGIQRLVALSAGRPVLGLGGITPDRAADVRDAGGWGVAVLGALSELPTPQAACAAAAALCAVFAQT